MVEKGDAELTVLAVQSLLYAQSPPLKQQNKTKQNPIAIKFSLPVVLLTDLSLSAL